jgi:hypothetical protein
LWTNLLFVGHVMAAILVRTTVSVRTALATSFCAWSTPLGGRTAFTAFGAFATTALTTFAAVATLAAFSVACRAL